MHCVADMLQDVWVTSQCNFPSEISLKTITNQFFTLFWLILYHFALPSHFLYWRGITATMCLSEYLVFSIHWLFISINIFCNLVFLLQFLFCCHCGFCLSPYCIFQQVLFYWCAVSFFFPETVSHNVVCASLNLMK